MYPQRCEKCRQGIHLANILPRRASFPVRSPQIMHNGQILPLVCDSAFCGGSAHDQRCGSGASERCGRPSRGGASVVSLNRRRKHHGAHLEAQALRSPFTGCKRCGSFFVRECQSGNESYRAGKAITNTAPPSGALNAVTVPSKLSTISFTMAKPRPAPPLLRAREASLR